MFDSGHVECDIIQNFAFLATFVPFNLKRVKDTLFSYDVISRNH